MENLWTKFHNVSIIFIIVITIAHVHSASGESDEPMKKMKIVKDKILKDYDRLVRPLMNETNTTEIFTMFIPRQVIDLDEERSLLTMDSYFYLDWVDPRLTWNKDDYNDYLPLPKDLVWLPDIKVYNSHSSSVDPMKDVPVTVTSYGLVQWFTPMLTQTSCSISSVESYPYDEALCDIIMGSWVHDGWEMNFTHYHELSLHEFENIHPRWELIESRARSYREVHVFECCPEPYITLHLHLPLRRRPLPELSASRASCIMAMILTLSIFCFPPESSKKYIVGCIVFIVLNILLVFIAMNTKNPTAVKYAVSYVQTAMYLVVVTLLLQVFVISKLHSQRGPNRPPMYLVEKLSGLLGKILCLRSPFSNDNFALDRVQLKEDSTTIEETSPKDEWQLVATALDRIFFIIMAVTMVAVHHL